MSNFVNNVLLPNFIGILIMTIGWYVSILNVGLTRFNATVLFTRWTLSGLVLIIIGAYFPDIWGRIVKRKEAA